MVRTAASLASLMLFLLCTALPAWAGDVRRSPGTRARPAASPGSPCAPRAVHRARHPARRDLPCSFAPYADWDLYARTDTTDEALLEQPVAPIPQPAPAVVLESPHFIPAADRGTPADQARRDAALARLLDRLTAK